MPTLKYFRTWCKSCDDFTPHRTFANDNSKCNRCDTVWSDITLDQIPHEKVLQQRERYMQKRGNPIQSLLRSFSEPTILDQLTGRAPAWPDAEIDEYDAGMQDILDARNKKYADEIEKRRKEKEELQKEYKLYVNLGRNDKCACGSGKKYKHCCIQRFQHY